MLGWVMAVVVVWWVVAHGGVVWYSGGGECTSRLIQPIFKKSAGVQNAKGEITVQEKMDGFKSQRMVKLHPCNLSNNNTS